MNIDFYEAWKKSGGIENKGIICPNDGEKMTEGYIDNDNEFRASSYVPQQYGRGCKCPKCGTVAK